MNHHHHNRRASSNKESRGFFSWRGEMATPCGSVLAHLRIYSVSSAHSRLLEDMMLFVADMFFLSHLDEVIA